MVTTREEMIAVLNRIVIPSLRQRGFTGSFPHLRRLGATQIDLMTFQLDKWGGGFIVEISKCSAEGITMPWGEKIPPKKVTAHDLNPRDRLRLGREDPGTEHWYRYDGGNTLESVAQEVVRQIDKAEKCWAGQQQAEADGCMVGDHEPPHLSLSMRRTGK